MFFWLLLIHSIASQDDVISIDKKRFFLPKTVICLLFWAYFLTLKIFVFLKQSQDPFYDLIQTDHINSFYSYLYSAGIALFITYLVYFCFIFYGAVTTIKGLKKTYRFALGTTIFVMTVSFILMGVNGQVS
jgi:hypothetical protein